MHRLARLVQTLLLATVSFPAKSVQGQCPLFTQATTILSHAFPLSRLPSRAAARQLFADSGQQKDSAERRRSVDRKGALQKDYTRSLGELQEQLLSKGRSLTERQKRWGLQLGGDDARLRRVVDKLFRGLPITTAIVGGSNAKGSGRQSLFASFCNWLTATFPDAQHVCYNGGIPGSSAGYMANCVQWHLPDNVDLVWIEYSVNDGYGPDINNLSSRAMERLVRRLLQLKGRPAVLHVHIPTSRFMGVKSLFYQTAEDHFGVVAQWYRLQSVSVRNLLVQASLTNMTGFTLEENWADRVHVGPKGAQKTGDLMGGLLQHVGMEMLHWRPYGDADEAAMEEPLPPPMFPGNYGHGDRCKFEGDFQELVTSSKGWTWVDNSGRRIPGYVSATPGAKLVFAINTQTGWTQNEKSDKLVPIVIGFKMFKGLNIGKAEMTCISGCTCEPTVINGAFHRGGDAKLQAVKGVSQHKSCQIQLEILKDTETGANNFKVHGVLVGEENVIEYPWYEEYAFGFRMMDNYPDARAADA